jgi:hypothetical protein
MSWASQGIGFIEVWQNKRIHVRLRINGRAAGEATLYCIERTDGGRVSVQFESEDKLIHGCKLEAGKAYSLDMEVKEGVWKHFDGCTYIRSRCNHDVNVCDHTFEIDE